MRAALSRVSAGLVTVLALLMPAAGYAQTAEPFTPPQLDQLLAPIALYPDPLLGQILMASTYPLEVVEATRWLQEPGNASLNGDQLAVALQSVDWDPSVKSLLVFPQTLQMMSSQPGWLQQLGDAFLAQQAQVMDSVQRLRAQARSAGTLYSTPEALVSSDGAATTIEPANPQLIYLPSYDTASVYGDWPYPDYPPYYFPGYPAYGSLVYGGISFSTGIAIVMPLWGWDECDWRNHRIRIDDGRYTAINGGRRPAHAAAATWQHDPVHRRGVAYREDRSRQRFLGQPGNSPETRRAYRGFEGAAPSPVAPSAVRPDLGMPQLPAAGGQRGGPGRDGRQTPQPGSVKRQAPVRPSSPQPSAAFGGIDRGREVQREAERGRASRESQAPPMRREPVMAPRQAGPLPQASPAGRAIRRDR